MFLAVCGASPWAARRILHECSLAQFLSLPPEERMANFQWAPDRALKQLAFIADGGDDDEDEEYAPQAAPPQRLGDEEWPHGRSESPHMSLPEARTVHHSMALPSPTWTPPELMAPTASSRELSLSAHAVGPDGQRQLCWSRSTAACNDAWGEAPCDATVAHELAFDAIWGSAGSGGGTMQAPVSTGGRKGSQRPSSSANQTSNGRKVKGKTRRR